MKLLYGTEMKADYSCLNLNLDVDSETYNVFSKLTDSDEKMAIAPEKHLWKVKLTAN